MALAQMLPKAMDCRVIYPQQLFHIRINGKVTDTYRALLPGYLFLYTEDDQIDLSAVHLDGIIRVLPGSDNSAALLGNDHQFAIMLLKNGGVISKTRVYREGQQIRIVKGAFSGVSADILKVDRRSLRMQIALTFANQAVKTWVEYEIVDDLRE